MRPRSIARVLRLARRSPAILIGLALVAAISTGISLHWDLLGFDRRSYIAKNEEILDSLPTLPGAILLETRTSSSYGDSKFSPAEGHTTSTIYRMPAGTTWDAVLSFYTALAEAWEVRVDSAELVGPGAIDLPQPPQFLIARQGSVLVSVALRTDGPAGSPPSDEFPNQYWVSVDH